MIDTARGKDLIRLNFVSLTTQEFEFKVYRKKYEGEKKEGNFEHLYKNSLPNSEGITPHDPNSRGDYWISFEKKKGFEEFICKHDYNHQLTKRFIFHLLFQKTKKLLEETDYVLPSKSLRNSLSFILKKHPEGNETVWLEPHYLQPVHKFGFLLDFKFDKKENVGYSRIVQKLSLSLDKDSRSNKNFYIDKFQKLENFFGKFKEKIFPLTFENMNLDISTNLEGLEAQHLGVKKYVFANGQEGTSQFQGVDKYGPLENINHKVKFVFVFKEKDKYLLEDLRNALNGTSRGVLFKGMQGMFRLSVQNGVEDAPISDFSSENLDHVTGKIDSLSRKCEDVLVMPILIGDQEDHETYYSLKYRLLKKNIPLQVVTTDLLRQKDGLKWSTSNIALQIFAKLGGKPWKVLPSHEKAIIFGIGQAHQKRDGEVVKYYAYSVCVDSSGIYKKINVLGKSGDEADYLDQLGKNITNTIRENLTSRYNKCVLHIPFKIKRKELEKIKQSIEEIANSTDFGSFDFVVLKVNSKNKFFGYAYTNSLVPYESSFITLSNRPEAYLVWFEGLQYHRETIYKRMSNPVYIEFYYTGKELTKEDREKYLQDVLNLSGTNWRGFNAKNIPISIYYCELVTQFLKSFPEEIKSLDNIPAPWFL